MHGLFNRSIQCFVLDEYGKKTWGQVVARTDARIADFEAMSVYRDGVTLSVIDKLSEVTGRSRADMLEDFGTYLVTEARFSPLRRLLRFGGESFEEFLFSLNDLHGRAELALAELQLPPLVVRELSAGKYILTLQHKRPEIRSCLEFVLVGLLRAMADDYGALVTLDISEADDGGDAIVLKVIQPDFAHGREFQLAEPIAR